jgi:putative membrane protein
MWTDTGMMGWGWGWGTLGAVHMVLWWALVLLGIAVLARWLFGASRRDDGGGNALAILSERYARSEISKDEYEQKKRELST